MSCRKKIPYSSVNYIIVRTDVYDGEFDVCLYSFDNIKKARNYAFKDICDTMKRKGIVYSKTINDAVSYSNDCGNDYWYWGDENSCDNVSWEIRKIHTRTTSEWENPDEGCTWVKIPH